MKNVRRVRGVAATAAAAALLPAVGATASSTDTEVTFEVTGTSTSLSISTAADTAALVEADGVASGTLPVTTIHDARGNLLGLTWAVQAQGSDFDHADDLASIAASSGHVYIDATTAVDATLSANRMTMVGFELDGGIGDLGAGYTLAHGTSLLGLLGSGSLSYQPSMKVTVPEGQLGGTYSGTVTQTVSGS